MGTSKASILQQQKEECQALREGLMASRNFGLSLQADGTEVEIAVARTPLIKQLFSLNNQHVGLSFFALFCFCFFFSFLFGFFQKRMKKTIYHRSISNHEIDRTSNICILSWNPSKSRSRSLEGSRESKLQPSIQLSSTP